MNTYFIFKCNNKYINICKNTPLYYYMMLKSIYSYNKYDIDIAFNLFNEIIDPINKEYINNMIYDKLKDNEYYIKFKNNHTYNNYFNGESSKITINNSYIKLKSNKIDNIFMNDLKNIKYIFLCDFMYDKYKFYNNDKLNNVK